MRFLLPLALLLLASCSNSGTYGQVKVPPIDARLTVPCKKPQQIPVGAYEGMLATAGAWLQDCGDLNRAILADDMAIRKALAGPK